MFYYNTNLKFSGAVLLSVNEASTLLTEQEKQYKDHWWLRTPGSYSDFACFVNYNGYVSSVGSYVDNFDDIRPALIISDLGGFKVGDILSIGEYYFKIISPELAWLYKQDIGKDIFDFFSNNYETSHVKQVIDAWYETLMEEMR